jgi:CheY-like chemotaxis protein
LRFTYPDREICVLARDVQMSQLIVNLCRNASDSLEGRTGHVAVELFRAPQSELAALAEKCHLPNNLLIGTIDTAQPHACLRVGDDGSGIPPELLKRIFEPFFTTKGRHRGTGLGLAVVHGVIEAHGGACLVETIPARGTTFSVYLPMSGESHPNVRPPDAGFRNIRGRERILIVDDEPDIADMLSIGFDRLGYVAVGVNDPLDALAAFEEDPMAWDAVVTDQLMPAMRGLELAGRLKSIRPDLKTVLCSGFSDAAKGEIASGGVIDAFFQKPTDAQAIASSLRELFDSGGG